MQKILLWGGIGFGVIIIIIVAVTLTSRGGNRNANQTAQNDSDLTTLTFWDPIDEPEFFKEIITEYQSANPNIRIKYEKKPLKDYELESTNAISAGKGPDIWAINHASLLRHQDKLVPYPQGELKKGDPTPAQIVKERYAPLIGQENVRDEKIYGLPLFLDTLVLYFNTDLIRLRFQDYIRENKKVNESLFTTGPNTWNDIVDLTQLYTVKNGDAVIKSAIALGSASNVNRSVDILVAMMLQNGALIASPDGLTATFNLPSSKESQEKYYPGTKALEFLTSFSDPKSSNYSWNNGFPSSYQAFRDGQTAMMIDYTAAARDLRDENPNLRFKYLPLPQIAGSKEIVDLGDYWSVTVPSSSKHKSEAWEFIRYLGNNGNSTYLAAARRPSAFAVRDVPRTIFQRIEFSDRPHTYQIQTARSWYRGRDPEKVEKVFYDMINNVNTAIAAPQSAIDDAARKTSEIFRQREGFQTTSSPTPLKKE